MKRAMVCLIAGTAAIVLLSGCGPVSGAPVSHGPATSAGTAQPSFSSAETAQTPTLTPSSAAVSAPPTTVTTSTKPKRAAAGTALAAVAKLTVKGRAPKTGYTRAQFGQAWYDADRNGCDTRNDILLRDLKSRQIKNACKVLAGTLAPDPYTGTSIRFVHGGASEVDIDHVVALSDAWQKGAARWAAGKRLALANDPLNLLAVDSAANRSKGDGDAATWLPPNKAYRCTYVARQVAVKASTACGSLRPSVMPWSASCAPARRCACRGRGPHQPWRRCPGLRVRLDLLRHPSHLRRLPGPSTTPTAPQLVRQARRRSCVVNLATPASSTVTETA
jgi:Protein of unknown function (DUF1524)